MCREKIKACLGFQRGSCRKISSGDIPQQHAGLFLVLAPPRSPRKTYPGRTLVEPWWNPRGTLPQGRAGPPRNLSFSCCGKNTIYLGWSTCSAGQSEFRKTTREAPFAPNGKDSGLHARSVLSLRHPVSDWDPTPKTEKNKCELSQVQLRRQAAGSRDGSEPQIEPKS